jgi:hypothetical protein
MTDVSNLVNRITAEFTAAQDKKKKLRDDYQRAYEQRQARLAEFSKVLDDLRDVWRPRLEALARQFGDRVQVTPHIEPARREATFAFDSTVARIKLRFSASTDRDIRKVVLGYDLEIIPVLMRFDRHAELELPLENIDRAAAARWIDDRIVDFVRTYLRLHEGQD